MIFHLSFISGKTQVDKSRDKQSAKTRKSNKSEEVNSDFDDNEDMPDQELEFQFSSKKKVISRKLITYCNKCI